MSRKRVGEEAMTAAERKRRQRARERGEFDSIGLADEIMGRVKRWTADDLSLAGSGTYDEYDREVENRLRQLMGVLGEYLTMDEETRHRLKEIVAPTVTDTP